MLFKLISLDIDGTLTNSRKRISPKTRDKLIRFQKNGGIDPVEMERVFNMGIGIAMVVKKNNVDDVLSFAKQSKIAIRVIGEIVNG